MLSSLGEIRRLWLWILGGGGDQLRGGTMFLATLYFALPLLGKSRPLLAFSSRFFHGGPLQQPLQKCGWVPLVWVEEVLLGGEEVQESLGLGSSGGASLSGFYFALFKGEGGTQNKN